MGFAHFVVVPVAVVAVADSKVMMMAAQADKHEKLAGC